MRRTLCLAAVVAAAALTSACGGDAEPAAAPLGTPERPLVAETTDEAVGGRSNEAQAEPGAARKPNYAELVERQTSRPQSRFTPCNLVTRAEAARILGTAVQAPLEAPQGPTCVYRSQSGRTFVTVAVQSAGFDRLRSQLRRREAVDVADRRAACGVQGEPVLHVSLPEARVLTVGAPCSVAREFAALGLGRLNG